MNSYLSQVGLNLFLDPNTAAIEHGLTFSFFYLIVFFIVIFYIVAFLVVVFVISSLDNNKSKRPSLDLRSPSADRLRSRSAHYRFHTHLFRLRRHFSHSLTFFYPRCQRRECRQTSCRRYGQHFSVCTKSKRPKHRSHFIHRFHLCLVRNQTKRTCHDRRRLVQ